MLERRTHGRSRDFALGTIIGGEQRLALDCVVRDISDGGALLLMDEPRRAPTVLRLTLGDGTRLARIVWRSEAAIAVAFAVPDVDQDVSQASADVVSLDAVRKRRQGGSDEQRLAERIARFVGPARRPHPL